MKQTLLTLTVTAAMAFGGTSALAGPDAEDIAGTLAGVAAAALILKGLSDHKAKNRDAETKTSGHTLAERIGSGKETLRQPDSNTRVVPGRVRPVEQVWGQGKGHGYKKRPLPNACRVVVETRRGDRLAYASRCLERTFQHARRLPTQCEALIQDGRRRLTAVYGARCLARDGWRVATR